jgi:Pput_2613-like deaminase
MKVRKLVAGILFGALALGRGDARTWASGPGPGGGASLSGGAGTAGGFRGAPGAGSNAAPGGGGRALPGAGGSGFLGGAGFQRNLGGGPGTFRAIGIGSQSSSPAPSQSLHNPATRTVANGPVPGRHNANTHIKGEKPTTFQRQVSGGLSPAQRQQHGNNAQWKAHTEPQALPHLTRPQQTVVIVGQKPPCNRCQGEMRQAVQKTGGKVEYLHRADGRTVRTRYEQLLNGDVKRTTSRFDRAANERVETVRIHNGRRWTAPKNADEK